MATPEAMKRLTDALANDRVVVVDRLRVAPGVRAANHAADAARAVLAKNKAGKRAATVLHVDGTRSSNARSPLLSSLSSTTSLAAPSESVDRSVEISRGYGGAESGYPGQTRLVWPRG